MSLAVFASILATVYYLSNAKRREAENVLDDEVKKNKNPYKMLTPKVNTIYHFDALVLYFVHLSRSGGKFLNQSSCREFRISLG